MAGEALTLDEVCERAGVDRRVLARELKRGGIKEISLEAVEAWLISRSIANIERQSVRRERPARTRTSIHGKWG
jgi:predicted site-specific integrase-resolvase